MTNSQESRKSYRLLTGPDNAEFCQRVSDALQEGYVLWGSPVMTHGPNGVIVGQAVVLPNVGYGPNVQGGEHG